MVIKLRATKDGQQLMVTKVDQDHSHPISELTFKFHPMQRRLDSDVAEEVKMCQLQAKKKLIQGFIQQKTGKKVTLKDIHNVVSRSKTAESTTALKDIAKWLQDNYPSLDAEFVLDENQVLDELFLQDSQMKDTFQIFSEVLLGGLYPQDK